MASSITSGDVSVLPTGMDEGCLWGNRERESQFIPVTATPPQPLPASPSLSTNPLGEEYPHGIPQPCSSRAGCRCPVLGSIVPRAEPFGRLLFALGGASQALSPDNSGTKQFPKAPLLTNEGFRAFVLNPMLFSLQTAGKKCKRRRDDPEC